MVRSIVVKLLWIVVLTVASCRSFKSNVKPDERVLTVWASAPDEVLVIATPYDSTLAFYFNRSEWFKSADLYSTDSIARSTCRAQMDSLEKQDGIILLPKLSRQDVGIFDSLLTEGHVWIRYDNGDYVPNVRTYSVSDSKGKTVYFEDDRNGHLLYRTVQ